MLRKGRIVVLALALLLALAPPTPRANASDSTSEGARTALKYIACAGSIVLMVVTPASVFYTALVCIDAFLVSEN